MRRAVDGGIRFRASLACGAAAFCFAAACGRVAAQPATTPPSPAPQPSATPAVPASPTPSPRPLGLGFTTRASATFIDDATRGPGQTGPESQGFIAGSPLAPNTPYDLFSSVPQTPGVAGIGQLVTDAVERTRAFDFGVRAGLADVRGSETNAAYWGENLLPTLNPHAGAASFPYAVAFPTHAGQDDAGAFRLSLLGARVATADGAFALRGGWFDLAQTDRFVFAPPALTSLNPQIAFAPAESLSNGAPNLDDWQPDASSLPLHGIDLVAKRGAATLEVANAALPSLPGEMARVTVASLVLDRGTGMRLSAEVAHALTSGLAFVTTEPNGVDPVFTSTPQGVLPTSTLDGQRMTVAGVRAAFDPSSSALDLGGVVEIGRSWEDAAPAGRPGTQRPGGYYHAGVARKAGRATASLDLYRMEARYATLILPYGVAENQWSTAFAWPGQWLKSNYQLVDNSVLGVNRQGYRLRYFIDGGPLEVHLEYTDLRQIAPESIETSTQVGFVDGFYLPQATNAATFGRQRRYGAWLAWHPAFGDLSLDVVDDTLYRPFAAAHPEDRVSYEVPQAVLTFARHVSPAVVAATGYGRYAVDGAFAEPIDFAERLFFVGLEARETPASEILVTFRRSASAGRSTFPAAGTSPNFTAGQLIVEQRVHL